MLPNPGTAPPRVEGLQVYAQWDGDGICRSDAVEFFAREPGSTHDSVVVGGGSRVGEVCELLRGSTRKQLARKAIKTLVGDHHRRNAVFAAPPAQ
ncbi:Uncharacterised protein [Mycobacterium tuberculosis]|nr:Uncharacterised protein [Mycobacterium tuberculosis]